MGIPINVDANRNAEYYKDNGALYQVLFVCDCDLKAEPLICVIDKGYNAVKEALTPTKNTEASQRVARENLINRIARGEHVSGVEVFTLEEFRTHAKDSATMRQGIKNNLEQFDRALVALERATAGYEQKRSKFLFSHPKTTQPSSSPKPPFGRNR